MAGGRWHRLSEEERQRRRREGRVAWNRAHGKGTGPGVRGAAYDSEIEYTDEEREFLVAVDRWKGETGTRFPTLTQLLGVLKSLGYRRVVD
jgi:hypothetical protein